MIVKRRALTRRATPNKIPVWAVVVLAIPWTLVIAGVAYVYGAWKNK